MNDILDVWLHGEELGELEKLRNGSMRLRFSGDAISRYGAGSRVLSLSIPVSAKRIEDAELGTFIDGLLPEQGVRRALEHDFGLNPRDSFGLLRHIGAECAGAAQFTSHGTGPQQGFLRPLSNDEVDAMVQELPTLAPPDGLPITASLGGVQAKVLLTRTAEGWAWPAEGAASTHIIKPEPIFDVAVPHLIESEEWSLRLARNAGLKAARASLASFGGRKAIVVERYDRVDGQRRHQEDFTQALGVPTDNKYESSISNPTRLSQIAVVAGDEARDRSEFQVDLLRSVIFNVLIGNGDAHSKNYSLMIDEQGIFSMAPLYDTAPVFLLNSGLHHSGHVLDGHVNLNYITRNHLERAAMGWGMRPALVRETVNSTIDAVLAATKTTVAGEGIEHVPGLVAARVARFAATTSFLISEQHAT